MQVETVELAPNEKRCTKCEGIKDKTNFGRTPLGKEGLKSKCKACEKEANKQFVAKRRAARDPDGLICPECNQTFSNLFSHGRQAHGWNFQDLANLGIDSFMSKKSHENLSLSISGPRPNRQKGDYAELGKDRISFPKKFWSLDCKYAKIKVLKDKRQVHFNPITKKAPNTKAIEYPSKATVHRLRVHLHHEIMGSIDIFRPVFELRQGAGFYIQFFEQDEKLLEPFEVWAKSGISMKNQAGLTTFSEKETPSVTIANHIWPSNAEYAYPEWYKAKRGNTNYLDLFPVSRTGFIVGVNRLDFKQYAGLEGCRKLIPDGKRFRISLKSFILENNIPSGDWDLKEVLPSGALRFRLYKERQPKEQQEIAS